jgi:hypothetical protein
MAGTTGRLWPHECAGWIDLRGQPGVGAIGGTSDANFAELLIQLAAHGVDTATKVAVACEDQGVGVFHGHRP